MKKLFLLTAVLAILSFYGCENGKTETQSADVPQGMMAADLSAISEGRMNVLINVPDSTSGPLQLTLNSQGGVDVVVGKNFQVSVNEGSGNMELKKADITNDDVRKFVKYSVEEPNAIVWEWQIEGMEPEFHFYAIISADGKTFEVRDVEGEMFSEKAALQMLEAAKSIRPKVKA